MKKLLLLSLLACVAISSCKKKEPNLGPFPSVTQVAITPEIPLAFQNITFTITVDSKGEPYTAVLEWRVNPTVSTKYDNIMMNKVGPNVNSAKLSGYVTGAKIEYRFRISTKSGRIIMTNNKTLIIGGEVDEPEKEEEPAL